MKKQTFNKKEFLVPHSPRSMASYHAKVMEDGIMKLTMHDCRGSIQLYNDLNNPDEITESLEKLNNLASGILELIGFIERNYEMRQDNQSTQFSEQLNHLNLSGADIIFKHRRFKPLRQAQSTPTLNPIQD